MNHCPDPSLIYVDAEQGYACGASVSVEDAAKAFAAMCNELKRVDGAPCTQPTFDARDARAVIEAKTDICWHRTAYTDGETCGVTISTTDTGGAPRRSIVAWGIGGVAGPGTVTSASGPKLPLTAMNQNAGGETDQPHPE